MNRLAEHTSSINRKAIQSYSKQSHEQNDKFKTKISKRKFQNKNFITKIPESKFHNENFKAKDYRTKIYRTKIYREIKLEQRIIIIKENIIEQKN